jgi:hypothetical protein
VGPGGHADGLSRAESCGDAGILGFAIAGDKRFLDGLRAPEARVFRIPAVPGGVEGVRTPGTERRPLGSERRTLGSVES